MENIKVLVAGVNSSIASYVIPKLGIPIRNIYGLRKATSSNAHFDWVNDENLIYNDFLDGKLLMEAVIERLGSDPSVPFLILNFIGTFGLIESATNFHIDEVLSTLELNLRPFLILTKTAQIAPKGSLFLSFSGAGVGGGNLDDSSLGYLASKSAMALLVESLDTKFSENGVRVGLIAPGAFPSRMQDAIAGAPKDAIPVERQQRASLLTSNESHVNRLVDLILWLAVKPSRAGGRIWSAVYDDFPSDEFDRDFGKLRRVY